MKAQKALCTKHLKTANYVGVAGSLANPAGESCGIIIFIFEYFGNPLTKIQ